MKTREIVFDLRNSGGLSITVVVPLDDEAHRYGFQIIGNDDGIEFLFNDGDVCEDKDGEPVTGPDGATPRGAHATWDELDALAIEELTEHKP